MPFYTYRCKNGHATEARAGYEDQLITCPACGRDALRAPFYEDMTLITETGAGSRYGLPRANEAVDSSGRYAVSRLQEAQAEIAHEHDKSEERAQKPLRRRNYWRESVQRANALTGGQIRG